MSDDTLKRKADSVAEENTETLVKKPRQESFTQDAVPAYKPKYSRKYRPEYTERDAKLAKFYSDLASEARNVRIQAATGLVRHCEELSEGESEHILKILTRLVKGLCSSRKAARLGFFTALTEILRLAVGDGDEKTVSVPDLLELIKRNTVPDGHASGQEKRDYLIGRMSSHSSIINSGILFKTAEPSSDFEAVMEALCTAAQETQWLREECGLNLCTAIRLASSAKCEAAYAESLINILDSHKLSKTPEGVAVWLAVRTNFTEAQLPHNIWHHQDPLYKKSLPILASVFKQTNAAAVAPETTEGKVVQAGNRQMAPNFAWEHVIASFIQGEGSRSEKQKKFRQFWIEVVDNGFFAATASAERKSLGFQIFTKVIASCPEWALEEAFSPKLLKCLINQSAKSERYLNKTAKSLLESIVARAKADPALAPAIVAKVLSENGSVNFDKATDSETLSSILQGVDEAHLLQVVRRYLAVLMKPGASAKDERAAQAVRQAVADQLLALVRKRYTRPREELAPQWLQEILLAFASAGYTIEKAVDGSKISPPMTAVTRDMLKARLSSCLTHTLGTQVDEDSVLPTMVAKGIADINPDENEVWSQADPAVQETIKHGLSVISKLDSKVIAAAGTNSSTLRGLKLLFCVSLIQVYSGETDALEMLNELQDCYKIITSSKDDDKEQAFSTVLEVILGFTSKSSLLYRKLAEQSFSAIASKINDEALQSMLDVLAQDEGMAGQQALFEQNEAEEDVEGSDGESGSDDDSDESSDDDVEEVDTTAIDSGAETDEEEDDNNSSSSDDAEGEDDTSDTSDADVQEIADFEKMLANTLKTSLATEDDDESSTDGEDMDDEEMMALEPSLTKIFQQRRDAANTSKKAEKKNARELILNFKNRVLDLLLIYVKAQSSNPLAVGIIVPLLALIRSTRSKQISSKTIALLRAYFDGAKKRGLPKVDDEEEVWRLLREVHDEALRFASHVHAAAASRASLFLARLLLAKDQGNKQKITEVYAKTKVASEEKKSKVPVSFWRDWDNWCATMKGA